MDDKTGMKNCLYIFITLICICCAPTSFCQDNFTGEFILFPYLEAEYNSSLDDFSALDNDEYEYGVDIFATSEYGIIRFLGEFLLSRSEQEFERLQLGLLLGNNKRLWLGRFHNPVGFWNSYYHHGDILEAAITRPSIEEFEDDGGIQSMHNAGMLFEGLIEKNEGGIGYAFALATATELTDEGLETWNPLKPSAGDQDISTTINIYYEPELYEPTRYGVFASYAELPAQAIGLDEIQQTTLGAYLNWQSPAWHVISAIYYLDNDVSGPATSSKDSFFHAYLQAEYEFNTHVTMFARLEGTFNDRNDIYLDLFPDFVEDRILAGAKFDFLEHHALKIEVSENKADSDGFFQIKLQWSAVF